MIVVRKVPLFEVNTYFITTLAEAKEYVRANGDTEGEESAFDNTKGCCYTLALKSGGEQRLMCIFDDGNINTIIHEAVHMAGMTLKYCSINYSNKNDEPLAYLTAWFAEEMMSILNVSYSSSDNEITLIPGIMNEVSNLRFSAKNS